MERRQDSDDRRKIERFSNPPVRSHFKQIHLYINFLMVLCFLAGVYHLSRGIYIGESESIAMGIFLATMAFVVTTYLFKYSSALKDYLTKESLGSLDRAMETLSALWFVVVFLSVIYTVVYFIFD